MQQLSVFTIYLCMYAAGDVIISILKIIDIDFADYIYMYMYKFEGFE